MYGPLVPLVLLVGDVPVLTAYVIQRGFLHLRYKPTRDGELAIDSGDLGRSATVAQYASAR